jgi:hypothetical protein
MSPVKRLGAALVAVLAAGSLAACSDDSTDDSAPIDSSVDSAGEPASGSYEQECDAKKAAGQAMLDAADEGSKALRGDDVEAARAAYVAYYDAYEQDVQATVALVNRIKDDPDADERVVEAVDESLAAADAFEATVAAAREQLAQADSIEAITQTFDDFQNGLRGPPPGNGPQLLPPALVSWSMAEGKDCGATN